MNENSPSIIIKVKRTMMPSTCIEIDPWSTVDRLREQITEWAGNSTWTVFRYIDFNGLNLGGRPSLEDLLMAARLSVIYGHMPALLLEKKQISLQNLERLLREKYVVDVSIEKLEKYLTSPRFNDPSEIEYSVAG